MPRRPRLIYVLDRFPAETLNFVYNEAETLLAAGVDVRFVSLLPHVHCPEETRHLLARTETIRPLRIASALAAFGYYLLRRPATLLRLLGTVVLSGNGTLRKNLHALGHYVVGVATAHRLRHERDHLHAHFAFKGAAAALIASRLNGNTYSFTAHGSATVDPAKRYGLCAKVRHAAFVVAVSRYNRETIRQLCPGTDTPVHVNRTGVRLAQFPYRGPRPPRRGEPARLICVASLYPVKNHEGLLRACGLLAREGRDFQLDLVGGGDPDRRRRLEELARELDIHERVTFHGVVDHTRLTGYLREADLFVLASHSEGVPVAVMEAMAVGLPVIAPRVTGVPELVRDGESGLLVDPASPADIAAGIGRILDDPDLASSLATAARRRIETEYDMTANARRLLEILDRQGVLDPPDTDSTKDGTRG